MIAGANQSASDRTDSRSHISRLKSRPANHQQPFQTGFVSIRGHRSRLETQETG